MSLPQKSANNGGDIIETVIAKGDLSKLTPDERVRFYNETCRSLGLNPLTRPFEYITLSGQLRLYGNRACADQLRKIHGISIKVISQEIADGLLTIHVQATDKDGRQDEDLGVVNFPDALKGDLRANTIMKAITKAKRRVTMSISGLGFLDETEVADIPRDNPHVNRADDIVDVPPPQHPDRIPPGDPGIKPLPKKDAREIAGKLGIEMHAVDNPEKLKKWAEQNRNRVALLPLDWQDIFQGRYLEHMTELRNRPPQTDEKDWLVELDEAYRKCRSAADIFEIDRQLYDPVAATVPLEQQLRASTIREEYLKALEQEPLQ
jgi:hypothetical protein